jgi:hypothetical protein
VSRTRRDVYVDKTIVGDGEVTAVAVHFGFNSPKTIKTTNLNRYTVRTKADVFVSVDGKEPYPDLLLLFSVFQDEIEKIFAE